MLIKLHVPFTHTLLLAHVLEGLYLFTEYMTNQDMTPSFLSRSVVEEISHKHEVIFNDTDCSPTIR